MSYENIHNMDQFRERLTGDAELVAQMQAEMGEKWAAVYSDLSEEVPDASAEIVLRNPSVYLHTVSPRSLPEDLGDRWTGLLKFADEIAAGANPDETEWNPSASGLEKIQQLVHTGNLDPAYRGSVADIMRMSSQLFAESAKVQPGNTSYYAGNVLGAVSWFRNRSK